MMITRQHGSGTERFSFPIQLLRRRWPLTAAEKLLKFSLYLHEGSTLLSLLNRSLRKRIDDHQLKKEDYLPFRTLLNQYPEEKRGVLWYESSILLDGFFRKYAERTFLHLSILRNKSDNSEFDGFWQYFCSVLQPDSLTQHGYLTALRSRDEQAIWKEISYVLDLLAALNYTTFLNSGTLLGLIREERFLPHDDDVDMAVILRASTPEGIINEWHELKKMIKNTLNETHLMDKEEHFFMHKVICPDALEIDLFPAWINAGKVYIWPYSYGDIEESDLLPLKMPHRNKCRACLPNNPEALLEVNYGREWRNPDPSFRFNWNLAKARFKDFVSILENGSQ